MRESELKPMVTPSQTLLAMTGTVLHSSPVQGWTTVSSWILMTGSINSPGMARGQIKAQVQSGAPRCSTAQTLNSSFDLAVLLTSTPDR